MIPRLLVLLQSAPIPLSVPATPPASFGHVSPWSTVLADLPVPLPLLIWAVSLRGPPHNSSLCVFHRGMFHGHIRMPPAVGWFGRWNGRSRMPSRLILSAPVPLLAGQAVPYTLQRYGTVDMALWTD